MLSEMGYLPRKVAKSKPVRKIPETNPISCTEQYYIVKGVADKKFKKAKTGTGTYDWNGDGVDGVLNFEYVGRCK